MYAVVVERKADEQQIHPEYVLEISNNWD